ncbi:unnamed protein product [Closterium sp. Yama58-4]|nr:unnamed protein product [Closterium sp. Yama58-4]
MAGPQDRPHVLHEFTVRRDLDLLSAIFAKLPFKTLLAASQVCRFWSQASEHLFQKECERKGWKPPRRPRGQTEVSSFRPWRSLFFRHACRSCGGKGEFIARHAKPPLHTASFNATSLIAAAPNAAASPDTPSPNAPSSDASSPKSASAKRKGSEMRTPSPSLDDHPRRVVGDPRDFITALHSGSRDSSPGSSMHGGASGKSLLSHALSYTPSHTLSPPNLSPQSDPPSTGSCNNRHFRRCPSVAESATAASNAYIASHAHVSGRAAPELQELPHFTQPSSVRSERRGAAFGHLGAKTDALRAEGYGSWRECGSGSHIRSRAAAAAAGSLIGGSRADDFAGVSARRSGEGSGSQRGLNRLLMREPLAHASAAPRASFRADNCADATLAEAGTGGPRSCATSSAADASVTQRKGFRESAVCADDLAEAAAAAAAEPQSLAPWSSVFLVTVVSMVMVLLLPAMLPRVGPPPDELLLLPVLVMVVVLTLACTPTVTRSNPKHAVFF